MEEKYTIKQLVMYIVIIMAVLLIFYGITLIIANKQNNNVINPENEAVIDYDTILVQDIYNQNQASYYIFAYIEEDENVTSYNNLIETYSNLEESLKVYTIELDSAFNKKYVKEESNFENKMPTFKGTTLLKIENKKIVDVYEDEDIETILNVLVGE